MKLNGAIEPQGASTIYLGGSSNGAKYNDKNILLNKCNNKNINNNNLNNNNNNDNIHCNKINCNCNRNRIINYSNYNDSSNSNKKIIYKNMKINSHNNNNNNNNRTFNKSSRNNQNTYKRNKIIFNLNNNNSFIMQRIQQSIGFYFWLFICLLYVFSLLPNTVYCDENDNGFFVNSFSVGPETTTPEFDAASRGKKKFGDKCESTLECGFPGSVCDPKKKSCQCIEDLPVTNHFDKCGKGASINESCFFNEQCEAVHFQTECRDFRCVCRFEMTPIQTKEGIYECKGKQVKREPERHIDPAMIGVLVGMALMFIIICVVLRLFSNARWRENRTIFNTPNPRLMNVSLLRDSKLLHGQERRGSRISVRVPSRQPSMASLRPHSPNPSLGSRGTTSRGSSNASMTSVKSNRSGGGSGGGGGGGVTSTVNNNGGNRRNSINKQQQQEHNNHNTAAHQPLITNVTTNPTSENVTIEIIEPKK